MLVERKKGESYAARAERRWNRHPGNGRGTRDEVCMGHEDKKRRRGRKDKLSEEHGEEWPARTS